MKDMQSSALEIVATLEWGRFMRRLWFVIHPGCEAYQRAALSFALLATRSFRNGYCKSNPRKMVTMWAEKEMRNLMRLGAAGIRTAAPVQLRMHVLVMQFIGEDGVAAPRLRDAGTHPVTPCFI